MDKTKAERYTSLIDRVKDSYPSIQNDDMDELRLFWCDDCREINLWTYWQGRKQLDASIVLVGQDWGSPWDKSSCNTMEQIRLANQGLEYDYLHGNPSITDQRLTELFYQLGYDIRKPCEDLFFTNYISGYRNRGLSGGFKRDWAEHDKAYFRELINIIEPRVVLCLGKATFEGVIRSLKPDNGIRVGRYNSFVEGSGNPVSVVLDNGEIVRVFALAHCGALGTMNRNRGCPKTEDILEVQKRDWKKIIPYLNNTK